MRDKSPNRTCCAIKTIRRCCCLLWLGGSFLSLSAWATLPQQITYCVDPDWLPYEAIADGSHVGISADYIRYLQRATGIEFVLLPTESWNQTLTALQQGDCQLTPMLNRSSEREQYLVFSDVYFRSPNVLVSLREQPFLQSLDNIGERSLAVPEGYRLLEYLAMHYPEIPIVLVQSEADGLTAVASGRADLFIGSLYSINALIQQQALYQMKIAGWVGLEDELRLGVITGLEPLIPVLEQALAELSDTERIQIYRNWTQIEVIDHTNYRLIWQVSAAALGIILLLLLWNYRSSYFNRKLQEKNQQLKQTQARLQRAVNKLQFLSSHDPLTKTYNRNHFDQSMQKQRRQPHSDDAFSLIVLDIDYFKQINDQYGHLVGDQVLQELAYELMQQVRDGDQVTRWGGEEFVILCQKTSLPEAKVLAERIRQSISQQLFAGSVQLSCSFGLAEQGAKEPLMACFERADKALYQAKAEGRDRICLAKPFVAAVS
ncbi:diguanylate cyclase [Alkalimonas amylolytica]|uniref:diguanylate cyclase n=1 Tax=Alkalimonas amylolytica TaxID=152573 RepID=A0A1H4BQ85_ALKAM|nr:diguanylate cyclase [Alkalimonas amylolytica]SEA50316.1 diguanylate cyclase/periplasmic/7TM domain sensor diguanylate cyclase [Alkalimonas amylolytica]